MAHDIHFVFRKQLNRRTFLRGTGVAMALPWLNAMQPAYGATKPIRRFVAMTLGLGLVGRNLYPEESGRDYSLSLYLRSLQDLREQFTVISGTSHPGVTGGHRAEASILTANPGGSLGLARNTVSLDQHLAKHLGGATRFPSLILSNGVRASPSYTENGTMIPAEGSPSRLFEQLFVDGSPASRERQARNVRQGRSILDFVGREAKSLSLKLGRGDQQQLNLYLEGVRDLERRLAESEAWSLRPKPNAGFRQPVDIGNSADFIGRQRLMSDMMRMALQTDSTRFISYHLGGAISVVPIAGVEEGYHALSHHGMDEEKLAQLALVESAIIVAWGDFLRALRETKESGSTLLDQTAILLTSNLGNASNHDNKNMPVLLAGGGFRHGQHLAFDRVNNYPLPNLFLSVVRRLGLSDDRFATSTGTMTGLEMT